jgi:hypothetical protein
MTSVASPGQWKQEHTRALTFLTRWSPESPWSIERRSCRGEPEWLFTSFDHALLCLRLHDLNGGPGLLRAAVQRFAERALRTERGCRWHFSPAVSDIPADADSTSAVLTVLARAVRQGVGVPDWMHPCRQLQQFTVLQAPCGGIRTYFGEHGNNEVEPIINLALVELLLALGEAPLFLSSVQIYLEEYLRANPFTERVSEYYLGSAFLAERVARVMALAADFFTSSARKEWVSYLLTHAPANALEAGMMSRACSACDLNTRQDQLNHLLLEMRNAEGIWDFVPFYIQRTPRYEYGSAWLTTATALSAFQLAAERGTRR